ncbi:MAG: hypothetical protein KIT79_15395 [Deltaproteobacteria bacterium]|nr:hypothetical protein [Deltaproteobacteria bacterium]
MPESLELSGLTDWLTSPVEQTKRLISERAAQKAREEIQKKENEKAEWERTGQPWSKKADTLLTAAKWGVITIPLGIVAVSLMPLFRGAGTALGGTGAALSGIGAATKESAASVQAARESLTRRNPASVRYSEKWTLLRRLGDRYWQLAGSHPGKSRQREFFLGVSEGIHEASELARTENARRYLRRRASPKLKSLARGRLVAARQGNSLLRSRLDGRHRGLLVATAFLADPQASFPVFG